MVNGECYFQESHGSSRRPPKWPKIDRFGEKLGHWIMQAGQTLFQLLERNWDRRTEKIQGDRRCPGKLDVFEILRVLKIWCWWSVLRCSWQNPYVSDFLNLLDWSSTSQTCLQHIPFVSKSVTNIDVTPLFRNNCGHLSPRQSIFSKT